MKHGYVYFIIIALICIGCGADTEIETDTTGPARIIEIKKPKIHTKTDKIYADFDIVFSSSPVDLVVEEPKTDVISFIDWEQQGNIVTLYYRVYRTNEVFCLLSEDFLHEFDVKLAWNVGRKRLTLEIDNADIKVACEGINYRIRDSE